MKKLGFLLVLAVVILGVSCNAGFNSNNSKQLVGTWKSGSTSFTFYENGNLLFTDRNKEDQRTEYFVNGSKLIIEYSTAIFDYYFSKDGNILVLYAVESNASNGNPYPGYYSRYWLKKE